MYSGKSRLKKNERINFLSSEVKFHSTEERKIERRRICFLKLKETIKDPQRNESITLEQHNLQTLVAIFRFNISTPLSLSIYLYLCAIVCANGCAFARPRRYISCPRAFRDATCTETTRLQHLLIRSQRMAGCRVEL